MLGGNRPIKLRIINDHSTAEFQYLLSFKQWEDVFGANDIDTMFKNFLNTYLRCFYASYVKRNVSNNTKSHNGWITHRIKISYRRKRELYILSRTSNDVSLKLYYKKTAQY
jgi:hypothetical protein